MKYICLVGFILAQFCVFGQTHLIKGQVRINNKPLVSANVLLISGDSTIDFTITDSAGNFIIKNYSDTIHTYILQITHISCEKKILELNQNSLSGQTALIIAMQPGTVPLPEVIIESAGRGFSQKGDTTSFAVKKYADGSERVLEDILSRIPGIKIAENGKISFKGQEISRVMIEGTDLYKTNYRIATKNVAGSIVDSVEAIENHNPNPLLKNITRGNETILNIKLKDDQEGKWSGIVNMAAGKGYDNSLNAMLFRKNRQFVGLYSGNTTGELYTDLIETPANSILSPSNTFSVPITTMQAPDIPQPSAAKLKNSGHMASIAIGGKNTTQNSFSGHVSFIHNTTRQVKGSVERYIAYPDSIFLQSEQTFSEDVDILSAAFEILNKRSTRKNIVNLLNASFSRAERVNAMDFGSTAMAEKSNEPEMNLAHQLQTTTRSSEKDAFIFTLQSQYDDTRQVYDNFPGVYYHTTDPASLTSQVTHTSSSFGNYLSAQYHNRKGNSRFLVEISNEYSVSRFSLQPAYKQATQQLATSNLSRFSIQDEFTFGKLSFTARAAMNVQVSNFYPEKQKIFPSSRIVLKWSPSTANVFLLFGGTQQSMGEVNSFIQKPVLTDYRTIREGILEPRYFTNASGGFLFAYNDFLRGIDITASLIWTGNESGIVRKYTFSGMNSRAFPAYGPYTYFTSANFSVGKYLAALSLFAKMDASYHINSTYSGIDPVTLSRYRFFSSRIMPEIRSSFLIPVNFTLKAIWDQQKVLVDQNSSSLFRSLEWKTRIRYAYTKYLQLFFDASLYKLWNPQKSFQKNQSSFFNAELKYNNPGSKWQIRIKMQNITNRRLIPNYSFSDILMSTEETSVLGSRIMVGVTFQL
jgi:hypothetical protein